MSSWLAKKEKDAWAKMELVTGITKTFRRDGIDGCFIIKSCSLGIWSSCLACFDLVFSSCAAVSLHQITNAIPRKKQFVCHFRIRRWAMSQQGKYCRRFVRMCRELKVLQLGKYAFNSALSNCSCHKVQSWIQNCVAQQRLVKLELLSPLIAIPLKRGWYVAKRHEP